MTQSNKTHLTLVVDRSGSMQDIRNDAQGGLNQLIREQQEESGQCSLLLAEFDNIYEQKYLGDIKSYGVYTLAPRGATALLDAIGRAIVDTGDYLSKMSEHERPGLVLFCVVTDGAENSSQEYGLARVKEMIKHQTDVYNWQFTFLCSDLNSFQDAQKMQINSVAAFDNSQVKAAYAATSGKFKTMRGASAAGLQVSNSYTADQEQMMKAKV